MDRLPLGMEVGLGPGHIVLYGDLVPQNGIARKFWPMSVVAKGLDGSRCHLIYFGPGHIVLDGDSAPPAPLSRSINEFGAI